MTERRPRVFIGSSVESKAVADAFCDNIDRFCEPVPWTGVFRAGQYTLDELVREGNKVDFAVIVLDKDDKTVSRKVENLSPRDNAILELGLFMGLLGRDRVFFLVPRDRQDLKLPTDLLGVTPLEYDNSRSDSNLNVALGKAGRDFKTAISDQSLRPAESTTSTTVKHAPAAPTVNAKKK